MEELLRKQKTEVDELNRLLRNYKSDGPDRKKEDYLREETQSYMELYRIIRENHEMIQEQRKPSHDSQQYFTKRTFEAITSTYEQVMADARSRLDAIKQKSPLDENLDAANSKKAENIPLNASTQPISNGSNASGGEDTDVEPLNNDDSTADSEEGGLLNILYNEIMDCLASAMNLDGAVSLGFIEATIGNLNTVWSEFRAAYLKQKSINGKIDFSYPIVAHKYMKITGGLNDMLKPDRKSIVKTSDNQFSLPKLKLHEFNGKISEWKSFIANFDNKQIDDGLKIEYLKMSIKGDAAKLINHIDPDPENYHTCYDIIRKRYENKREILNSLIANIVRLPKMKSESAEQIKITS